jgi:hypothetical protein
MLTIRRAKEVFHQDGGWFDAHWHFYLDRHSALCPSIEPIKRPATVSCGYVARI